MQETLLPQIEDAMKQRISKLGSEFASLRTGRANPQLLEPVKVEYYGQMVPLKQVAAVSVPEARVLEIRPWDPTVLVALEKALQKADVGAMPQSDGKILRINMPLMTEERRRDIVKVAKKMGEEAKVALRRDRQEAMEKLKKAEKAKEISEDECRLLEGKIQKLTDLYVGKIDLEVAHKEKEITTV